MSLPPLLKLDNFELFVPGKQNEFLLKQVNFELNSGDLVAVMGVNGSGKSTFFRALFGSAAYQGQVLLSGSDIKDKSQLTTAKNMSIVWAQIPDVGSMTVYEVIALGRYPYTGFWGKLSPHDLQIIDQTLLEFKITNWSEKYFSALSDGQKQKVLLARSIAQTTPIILLDEPTTYLDIPRKKEFMIFLKNLMKENKAVLFSTHDWELVKEFASKVVVLHNQKIIISTPVEFEQSGQFDLVFNPKLEYKNS